MALAYCPWPRRCPPCAGAIGSAPSARRPAWSAPRPTATTWDARSCRSRWPWRIAPGPGGVPLAPERLALLPVRGAQLGLRLGPPRRLGTHGAVGLDGLGVLPLAPAVSPLRRSDWLCSQCEAPSLVCASAHRDDLGRTEL